MTGYNGMTARREPETPRRDVCALRLPHRVQRLKAGLALEISDLSDRCPLDMGGPAPRYYLYFVPPLILDEVQPFVEDVRYFDLCAKVP